MSAHSSNCIVDVLRSQQRYVAPGVTHAGPGQHSPTGGYGAQVTHVSTQPLSF